MEKSKTLGTNMVFVCYLPLAEANVHINLICFDDNFDHPRVNDCPQKTAQKATIFSTKAQFFVEKV